MPLGGIFLPMILHTEIRKEAEITTQSRDFDAVKAEAEAAALRKLQEKLLPGDCLYFKGNKSHFKDVGHVEMYTGPNECWGHGSGTGPTKKDLRDYCRRRAAKLPSGFTATAFTGNMELSRGAKNFLLCAEITSATCAVTGSI